MAQTALEAAKVLEDYRKFNLMNIYLPYGHADTLCPDGPVWKLENALGNWGPWSNKPWQMDFHTAGKDNQERIIICANRTGKSVSAGYETALHMTGLYPDWWAGRRFDKPVLVWTGSPTNETSRDIVQKTLLGGTSRDELGSGFIPRHSIIGKPKTRQAGVSDVVDQFKVRHVSGGSSTCIMKTYEQGWRKWQGTEPEVVWLDEEPEDNEVQGRIYTEALTRLLTSHGVLMVTFTPLLGLTTLVMHFQGGGEGVWMGNSTWEDVPHLLEDERNRLAASYPDHERQARTQGVPMMGEGRIFTESEEDLIIDPINIPDHWTRMNGIDFGIGHPFGLGRIAYDRDTDTIYVYDCYRKKGEGPAVHASQIKAKGDWIPVAWPHDGENREKGSNSGERLKDLYIKEGVKMLSRSARYVNDKGGAQPQWPLIEDIKLREKTGRFKIFSSCHEYIEERRNYHTKDGKIVAKRDDTLKAVFYAVMMRRFGSTKQLRQQQTPPSALRTR